MEDKKDEELRMLFLEKQLMQEVKKRKEKQQRAETLLEEAKRMGIDTTKYREALLDIEIENINELIKNSKPKWELINYDEFLYIEYDYWRKKDILSVHIFEKEDMFKPLEILKKLTNVDYKLMSFSAKDKENYGKFPSDLSEDKIQDLLKKWIYYSNTKVKKSELKFQNTNTRLRYILDKITKGIFILIVAVVVILIILLIIQPFL